jgi:membrane-associated phospholipid phosphatase
MIPVFAALHWPSIGLRTGVVAGALVIWFWTQSLIGRKAAAKDAIGDVVHNLTAHWHRYLSANPRAANSALMISSIFIDLFGLALIGAAIFGTTFAPFLAIIVLFSMRQICQSLCTLPPPPGIIWRNPGFPALLVTYDVGNDLFFSGHTALAVLGAIYASHFGPPWLAIAALVITLGQALIVLVLRAHYTLDVIAGVFAAFLAADIAAAFSPTIDAWLR